MESKFTGGVWENLGWNIGIFFITFITCGIAAPWMICAKQRWIARNTYIEGEQLAFDGTGGQLFGKYIVWLLLTIITCGIYGALCLPVRIQQWLTYHTYFEYYED